MNWVQYKDLLCYLCLCGWVVSSLSLTQEILGSNPTILIFISFIFLSLNSANSVKTFRENSNRLIYSHVCACRLGWVWELQWSNKLVQITHQYLSVYRTRATLCITNESHAFGEVHTSRVLLENSYSFPFRVPSNYFIKWKKLYEWSS